MREMFESIQSGVPVLDLGFDGNCSDALQEHIKIQNQMNALFTGTTLRHHIDKLIDTFATPCTIHFAINRVSGARPSH